ncbi:unnamed protein product [Phytophthora fragariaefolia]|uniref:Unnamed protein product n=1 Tax=Phytophthora fragariaefolia TaxID=1490495 RepID=A0A9W6U8N2_9STRA|nr:unnamed protein product [Phytophthora fragariaefolia]
MTSLLGEAAFTGFSNHSTQQQRACVARLDKYESSLIAHVSAAAQKAARAAMRAEAQSAAQASATNTASFAARPTTTKPVKMSVSTFDGKDSDRLVFWVREIEIALSAGQIYDARAQVAFVLSNLGGRARAWSTARQTATPGYFTTWSSVEQELRSTFLLANVAYRHRSNCLRYKQGKRSLQDYIMELYNLEAAMTGAPLSEDIKVTVFMDVVRTVRVSPSTASPKEQVPGMTLVCLSVAAVRCNVVVVPATVKGYPEPMTVLIDSGASLNFATKASVAKNNALHASALEASKIEPFIVLDMDDRYDLILGMPWLAKHEPSIDWQHRVPRDERQFTGSSEALELPTASPTRPREPEVGDGENLRDPNTSPMRRQGSAVCNRVASVQGTVTTQGADAAAAHAGRGGSVRAPPTQSVAAGSAHVEECAGVVARANKSGRVGTPTTQGVVAGSARATEDAGACARAIMSGRAGAPTSKIIGGDKVTSTPKAAASSHDAYSVAVDRVPQVLDVCTGGPKVGKVLTSLSTVAELLQLEELSYVEFLNSPKAGELT